jgi:restriction endonuclease Mrr
MAWLTWELWFFALVLGLVGSYASLFLIAILQGITEGIATDFRKTRLARSPLAYKIKLYQEAVADYQKTLYEAQRARHEAERAQQEAERAQQEAERAQRRKLRQYWMSLNGLQFEYELGNLYQQLGYRVESTPTSGDQGVDLILKKDGKTTIVQCKSHKQPVGPAVARELYGALIASGADEAVLACTSGFTQGVGDFVRGKPIALISAAELATIGESVSEKRIEQGVQSTAPSKAPICPIPGCTSRMVCRVGKFGSFWGCARYPRCKGTRNIH